MDVLYKQINRYGQQELRMNERFYSLSQDKQQRIINAAYKVFALNSYKKAPMSEIANEAEISKALLFHYFRNKNIRDFLWAPSDEERMVCVHEGRILLSCGLWL